MEPLTDKLVDIIEDVLLPGLSLMKANCAMAEELWLLISQFQYQMRYRFYGRLKLVHLKKHPELVMVKVETQQRTKYVMK